MIWTRIPLLLLLSCAGRPAEEPLAPDVSAPSAWDLASAHAERAGLRLEVSPPELLHDRRVQEGDEIAQIASSSGWLFEERRGVMRIRAHRGLEVDEAATAVAMGDCVRAMELLDPQEGPAERLAAAHCANQAGDFEGALALLPAEPDLLAPWFQWERARALDGLQRQDQALQALDGVALPGRPGLDLKLFRARLEGDRAALGALSDTSVGGEARWILADLSEGEDRQQALLALWAEARSPWDQRAAERLQAQGVSLPEVETPSGRSLAEQRAKALDRQYRVQEALALHEALGEAAPPQSASDHLRLARARMRGRAYPLALESFERALGPPDQATGGAQALHDYGLTFARTGDYSTSAQVYRRLMAQHPLSTDADTASFKLGYMAYDEGRCDEAVSLLQAHREARPDSAHLDEALWFASRCHWRSGDLSAMDALLTQLLRDRPRSSLVPGARYWKARLLGVQGDLAAEEAALREVLRRHPRTGYGWFAAERLGHRFPARAPASPPPWSDALAADPSVQRVEALLSVGLQAPALAELSAVQANQPQDRLALAWAHLRAGDARGAQRAARSLCAVASPEEAALQVCNPRPERSVIQTITAFRPLDPLLPYAIMNAESALDPSVTSPAGARGLMQLMPHVAQALHGQAFAAEPFDVDRLYAAPYNAALGTWELTDRAESLREALQDNPLPAVAASYNAGEEAVLRWLAAYPEPPEADTFTEDIGYTETRRYVKRVLGFIMGLREVYGDE